MSMCRVFSCVRRGCLLWPVHFLGKTLLVFALLHSVFQGQIPYNIQYLSLSVWLISLSIICPRPMHTLQKALFHYSLWLNNIPLPSGSNGKISTCNTGDRGLIPESGRSPGEGNGNPLQYSCLENSMNRGTWWATVHGVTKSLNMTD